MITHPLELESRMSPPPRDLDFVAWVNVAVIALFFGLFGSQFVLAPSMRIGVGGEEALVLPRSIVPLEPTGRHLAVVSLRSDRIILFEGGMYSPSELRRHMEVYVKTHPGAVMLVRSDHQVSAQALVDLIEMARMVGFANVLLAAEPPAPHDPSR